MQLLQSRTQELLLGSKKGEGMQVESLVRWTGSPGLDDAATLARQPNSSTISKPVSNVPFLLFALFR
jgi:hypothetical protein